MAAARKMDELLVSWLGSAAVYESILELIENYREAQEALPSSEDDNASSSSPREVIIPPFYPKTYKRRSAPHPHECWVYHPPSLTSDGSTSSAPASPSNLPTGSMCDPPNGVRDHVQAIYQEIGQDPPLTSPSSVQSDGTEGGDAAEQRLRRKYIPLEAFVRITKDVCRFPSFFNTPLYQRILLLWNTHEAEATPME